MTWEEAQEAVREFAQGEVRAITPMAGEMIVVYDKGRYGPKGRDSPPNVELITKADSIWETWTDDGSMSFRSILRKYPVEVLEEVDLTHSRSDAKSKAYVGVPKNKIQSQDTSSEKTKEDGYHLREQGEIERALEQAKATPGVIEEGPGDLPTVLREIKSDSPARYVEKTLEWVLQATNDETDEKR